MNCLNQALRQNNEGVKLLLENREQDAVTCLTQSLKMVKHLLANEPSDQSRSSSNPFKTLNIQLTAHTLTNLQDCNCFIYSSLLAFSPLEEAGSVPSEDTIQVYCAVIILNLSLAYHRKGLGGNEACLAKAEKMYDMVTKLLSGCEDNHVIVLVVKLASINNVSQLRHNHGDYSFSQEGFRYLGYLIHFAGQNLESSSLCSTQMYQGMLLNVLCLAPPDAASAA
jgi:hypothetical protein